MFTSTDDYAVRLVIFAIVLELTVSANLLTFMGIPYVTEGGSLLFKLHPGTHMVILSFALLATRRDSWFLLASCKSTVVFLVCVLACVIYALALTGVGNVIVLLDTFLPAGLAAFVLRRARPGQIRRLRTVMQVSLAANAAIALAETASQATLIPLYLNDMPYLPHHEDFRPTALFDHPLTGSVMAILGLALAPRRCWWTLPYLALMWAALLAFGGRVALGAAVLMTSGSQIAQTADMIVRRHRQAPRRVAFASCLVAGAVLAGGTALSLGLGQRLAGHLYWDDSAQVRLAQWKLLDQLDTWQILFGTRREDLLAMLVSLRLGVGVEVIENFWLLMFVSLGMFGFPFFLGMLSGLIAGCWRQSQMPGRLLLLAVVLVASTSNSIGRKSTILVCMVAAIACLSGSVRRTRQSSSRQMTYGMATA